MKKKEWKTRRYAYLLLDVKNHVGETEMGMRSGFVPISNLKISK